MRSIRKVALAGATAAAVAFGSTSVAMAQDSSQNSGSASAEDTTPADEPSADEPSADEPSADEPSADEPSALEPSSLGSSNASLSSQLNTGLDLEGDQTADGRDIFGSEKDLEGQPAWAKALYALLVLGGIGSFIGLVVGPLVNFIKFGPFSR